jgi:hypothetical protein
MPPFEDQKAGSTKRSYMIAPEFAGKPRISHLLLQGDRLMVVVGGYGPTFSSPTGREYPVLYNYLATHVRLYKIVSQEEGVLQLVSSTHINGQFTDARAVDGHVHVVTTTGIDTWTDLIAPFEYYNFDGMSVDDYVEGVKKAAEAKAIPQFVNSIMTELRGLDGVLPDLFRISLMQSEASGTELEELTFADGVVNNFAQVYSFDMSSDAEELNSVKSGAFLPTYSVQVYGATNALILSGEGWEYDSDKGTSTQSTHLLGVAINGASSTPYSVGKVPGYILNSRSVDVKDNILRVATTIRDFVRFMIEPMPIDFVIPMPVDGESGVDEIVVEVPVGEDVSVSIPMPAADGESGVVKQVVEVTEGEGVQTVTSPSTGEGMTATEKVEKEEESSTQNLVITLDLTSSNGVMEQLGSIELGKPNEVFTAVSFFDNVAYAVTFEKRDPLYVLDLTDPTNPLKISELDVSGFSSYLHSINEDNTLILALGEEATDDGVTLGVQITIFDMTNPSDPKVAQRHVIENDPNTYSYSDALWDFMSVRYAAGRLIMPLNIDSYENKELNFHGFVVFVANENVIEEECRVSHAPEDTKEQYQCYCGGNNLPRRSMIFNGNLMTTESNFARLTDMDTCGLVWKLDITDEENTDDCYCYGFLE